MKDWFCFKLHKELIICCKHGEWEQIIWDTIRDNSKYKKMNKCINPIDVELTLRDILEKLIRQNEQIS